MSLYFERRQQLVAAQAEAAHAEYEAACSRYAAAADGRSMADFLHRFRVEVHRRALLALLRPERDFARRRALSGGVILLLIAIVLSLVPATSTGVAVRAAWFSLAALIPCVAYWRQVSGTPVEKRWRTIWATTSLVLLSVDAGHESVRDRRRPAFGFDEHGQILDTTVSAEMFPASRAQSLNLVLSDPADESIAPLATFALPLETPRNQWIGKALALDPIARRALLAVLEEWQPRWLELDQRLQDLVRLKQEREASEARLRVANARRDQAENAEIRWSELAFPDVLVERIIRHVELFADGDPTAPSALLLQGPPGNGKTSIAGALRHTAGCNFIKTSIDSFRGDSRAESECLTHYVWEHARAGSPCILFVDDCDAVLADRSRPDLVPETDTITQTFLDEWRAIKDGVRVLVIGATSRVDLLDDEACQRFGERIAIGMPALPERRRMFSRGLEQTRLAHALTGPDLDEIAVELRGWSAQQIAQFIASLADGSGRRVGEREQLVSQLRSWRGQARPASAP